MSSFEKKLTNSDVSRGWLTNPKNFAETIFPPLGYSTVQGLEFRDADGKSWRFVHVYRGNGIHVLVTGRTNFMKSKRLVAGDFLEFSRTENGDFSVGIRQANRVRTGDLIANDGPMDGLASGSQVNEAEQKEKKLAFTLFGQAIYNNEQTVAENATMNIHNGCKVVFDTGKTVDVSALKTRHELSEKLAKLFGLDAIHNATSILYEDSHGNVKRLGDELLSDFATSATVLRISLDECDLCIERKLNKNVQTPEHQTGDECGEGDDDDMPPLRDVSELPFKGDGLQFH